MNTRSGRSGKSMNPGRFPPRRWGRPALLAALGALPLLAGFPAAAADAGQPIVASLNPPPAGLACDAAAAATSVYFQFANPPFQVSQVSLYLDGKGVAQDAIEEHWPTVTMTKGLHPGTNTVDVVANGDNGQHIERRMIVQVGGAAAGDGTAVVACGDSAAVAQAVPAAPEVIDETAPSVVGGDEPEPVVVEDAPPVIYETPPPTVVYDYPQPVYVYNPYPVVAIDPWIPLVPFFSFGFFYSNYHPWCPPPHVVVNNYYHGGGGWSGGGRGGGWNGDGWRGNPGNRWNGGGWHGNPGNGWNGGGRGPYPAPNPGWHGAPRPGPAPQPAFNGGGNRGGWNNPPRPGPAPQPGFNAGGNRFSSPPNRGGGWNNAPRPAPRPMPAQPQNHPAWQGGPQRFASAPQFRPQQNFRPVQAAAPAFHGGSFGGGFHGGGGGFRGGAPSGGFHGGGGGHFGHR